MPASADIWTVTPTGEYTTTIRQNLDGLLGTSLQYVGTVDGVWSLMAGELAFRVDQSVADALSSVLTSTAPREVLVARLRDIGIEPRPATKTRVTVFKQGIGVLPLGSLLQTATTINPPFGSPVTDPFGQWEVVDNDTNNPANGATMVLECTTAGEASSAQPTASFSFITPVPPLTSCEYDEGSGSTTSLGRNAETTPELRQRLSASRVANGGSLPGVRQAVLNLDWVVACSVTGAAGVTTVVVAPAPVGADQRIELAETLLNFGPPGQWGGAQTETIDGPDGFPVTIAWDNGATEAVAVAWASVQLDGTVTLAEAEAAIESNVRAEFSRLSVGEVARYQRMYAATVSTGVTGITGFTLDGGTADVSPTTSADILIPTF